MAVTIPRTAWIDDDGSGTTGTVINNAEKTALYNQIDAALAGVQTAAAPIVQTITTTGTVGTIVLTPGVTVLRCANASLLTIQGMSAGVDGQEVTLEAAGAGQVNLVHLAGPGFQFFLPVTSGPVPLVGGLGRAVVIWDSTANVWRLKLHAQGAPISPPFNAAAFHADVGSWTVDAGDVFAVTYVLDAMRKSLVVQVYVQNTSIAGGPNQLMVNNAMWGGLVSPPQQSSMLELSLTVGWEHAAAFFSNTELLFSRTTHVVFPAETNTALLRGTVITFVT